MLKKKNRLSKIEFKKGDFFKNELFNLRISEGDQKKPRFAFVVSKKVGKRAVDRNETKRTLSRVLEENLDKIKTIKNIIIIANRIIPKEKKGEVEKNLIASFKKAKIIQ